MTPTLLNWLLWVPGCIAFAGALALLAAPAGPRRALARAGAAAGLLAPWLAPEGSVLRAFIALYLFWTGTKIFALTTAREPRPALRRWLSVLVVYELERDGSRRAGRRPELRLGLFASGALALGAAIAGLHVALFAAEQLPSGAWRWLARHGAGLVVCYLGVDGAIRLLEAIYRGFGLRPPVLHNHPILSLSVAEFWGRRWNRIVGQWLYTSFYRPLALRGQPRRAALATFAASALLHLYILWAAVDLEAGLVMGSFFLLQLPIVFAEAALHEPRWPTLLRRTWTVTALVLTSPLFVGPALRALEGGFR